MLGNGPYEKKLSSHVSFSEYAHGNIIEWNGKWCMRLVDCHANGLCARLDQNPLRNTLGNGFDEIGGFGRYECYDSLRHGTVVDGVVDVITGACGRE
jgi:hypothetical protein